MCFVVKNGWSARGEYSASRWNLQEANRGKLHMKISIIKNIIASSRIWKVDFYFHILVFHISCLSYLLKLKNYKQKISLCCFLCMFTFVTHMKAEMIKPCISNFGENYFLFSFSVENQILYWQNFACQLAKMSYFQNLVTYMTCTLVLTELNVLMLSWTYHFFFLK